MNKDSIRTNADHKKSLRLLEVRRLLKGKPYSTKELAAALNTDQRTAQRYLNDLQAVVVNPGERVPRYSLPDEKLKPVEALVTHSALRLLYHHTPGYNSVYIDALRKLAQLLPEAAQEIALKSTDELRLRKTKTKELDEGQALGEIAEAWFNRQLVEFLYRASSGSGQWRTNVLEVYFIEISRANLGFYVIGYERGYHKKLRTYKLNRMRQVKRIGEPSAYTITDFDPRQYLSNAWGVVGSSGGQPVQVRLKFRKDAAYRIQEGGYPNLSYQDTPDGSVEVCITVGTNNNNFPLELLSWVQSWGPRVEVLEPEGLRERWLEEARQVATLGERYGS